MINYKRLRDLREDNDFKQDYVAKYLDITQQQYQLYESGKREIKLHLIVKLAQLYQVSLDYIVGLIDEPKTLENKFNSLTMKQKKLLKAYSDNPKLQEAVDILLNIKGE
ncbi:MAG: helix-turn-helix transcriptional regulator [Clostridia bacterium]|nr:helix-turn-helix transcriptional regulator [Clostridia bacterium]